MIKEVLCRKARSVHRWSGQFTQRWLLLLNCDPLADDIDDVRPIILEQFQNSPKLRQFDGILWTAMDRRMLVQIPLPVRLSPTL